MIRRRGNLSGPRVIVIGLDGASFNHLDPILDSGALPNFSTFFREGMHSDCLSVIPPLTPPAWSTMLTGVNPGKHGIFDFIQPDKSGIFRMADASWRIRRSFMDHAKDAGIRTVSLLVPYTFPPDAEADGLVISGLGTPSAESDFIRPHSFRDRLLADFPFLKEIDPTRNQSLDTLHVHLENQTKKISELLAWSVDEFTDAGLFFAVFQATDFIPHFYSKYFDCEHHEYNPDDDRVPAGYRDALKKVYAAIDETLGACMDLVRKDGGQIFLISDHGSQPLAGSIGKDAFIADWLERNGFLKTGTDAGRMARAAMASAGSLANRLLYITKKYTPHGIRDAANRILGRRKEAVIGNLTAIPFMEDIVWEKTQAFCAPGGYGVGLFINRLGEFPHGIVNQGTEYHKIRDAIKSGLESLEIIPGVRLFNRILYREEAVWGPMVGLAPDLFLFWSEDRRLAENDYTLTDGTVVEPPGEKEGSSLTWCGTHRMEGLIGLWGDGIKHGYKPDQIPNLADVMPTIHMMSGMPIPSDVDGRPLTEAFEDRWLDENSPVDGPPGDLGDSPEGGKISNGDTDKLIDLLSGLGYLN